jgi:Cysteine-rich secretory protein family
MGIMQGKLCARLAMFLLATLCTGIVQAQRGEGMAQPAGEPQPAKAEQLFTMANATRAQEGRGQLGWDQALAGAAMKHCLVMAAKGPISHRYSGEADLTTRAAAAGAHFSLIEENIAVGSYPGSIHQGWLDSPGHRTNLLNPDIDRVGIAVVAAHGVLFAVADYARAVPVLTQSQVEAHVGGLLRGRGLSVTVDTTDARAACRLDKGLPSIPGADPPQFVMRWQDGNLDQLPARLVENLASGRYRRAAVGSCPPRGAEGAFTVYRVAVLLY